MTSFLARSNQATNPELYYVIGRLRGIAPIARNRFDEMYHWELCDVALNMMLGVCPDGIILQRGNECFVTRSQDLEPFDPKRTDWTDRPQTRPAPELTCQEWQELITEAGKEMSWFEAHYRKGLV